MWNDSIVLVTGGTGSWGHELTKQLLERGCKEVRVFARNELGHVHTVRKFNDDRITSIVGDVRDDKALMDACRGVDVIFHLAALKHVPVCEWQPQEAIKTNIHGTTNLISAANANKVKLVVFVSTDKAVAPYNLYGMTKGVAERLITQADEQSDTNFVCIRGGNVLGSNGSVVPLFVDQIKKCNKITITDGSMTRFYLTLPEAIGLLFEAAFGAQGGEIFVMNMPACKLMDLAEVLIDHYGDSNTEKDFIGIRPGEKLHEVLISEDEALFSYYWDNKYFVILPQISQSRLIKTYEKLPLLDMPRFASNTKLMSKAEIHAMLHKGGFLE